jgi:Ca2+-binding EF-hand superfamily protein/mono/diheme cytochrome c family protein/peroxiredoxin
MSIKKKIIVGFAVTGAILCGFAMDYRAKAQEQIQKRFEQLDQNGDGKVTSDELPQAALFKLFDLDSDGKITRDEATRAALRGRLRNNPAENLQQSGSVETTRPTEPAKSLEIPIRLGPKLLIPGEHGVGRFIEDVKLYDLAEKNTSLYGESKNELTVVAFTSTSCPISKKYLQTLVDIYHDFSIRGVRFILVNSIKTDKKEEMKTDASRFGDSIEYVIDQDSQLAKHFGATSTTDVVVIDHSRTIVYHGAIDDQYGFGYSIDSPRHTYLRDALEALLNQRSVLVTATAAPGCLLDTKQAVTAQTEVTYHKQIARLLQRHCVECHREGGVGPFALETYEDAVAHAPMIREVLDRGIMPPWFATPVLNTQGESRANGKQDFASVDTVNNGLTSIDKSSDIPSNNLHSPWINDRSLSTTEKQQLFAWLDQKLPEGNPKESPARRTFSDGWLIGKPDAIFEFEQPVKVKANGTMPYQNILVDTHLEEDHWVQAIEVRPGNPSVVHHVLVFVQGSEDADEPTDAAADERGGYWGIYVPGNSTLVYPNGYAKRIPKGARLRFQMHYTPNGTATEDSTSIGLVFAKEEPKHEVRVAGIANPTFRIPAGAANHPVVGSIRNLPVDVQILAFLPHMHLRGKAARYELLSNGETRTMLDIPRYDFNWQLLYRYAEPVSLKAGDTLQFTAWYDNSSDNPANPDPEKEIRWGPQTTDEMHLGYVEFIVPGAKPGEANPLAPRNRIRGAIRGALGSGQRNMGDALFRQLDTDGDGNVSRDEVKARFDNNPAASTTIFDRLDTDQNGQLSQQELRKLAEIMGR